MRSKMLPLFAALFLGAAALAVAPSASAQVRFRGTFGLPHGVVSVGVGSPYYYSSGYGGYGYAAPDYYAPSYSGYYYDGYYPSYYPRYYVRPHYYRSYYRPYRSYYRPHVSRYRSYRR